MHQRSRLKEVVRTAAIGVALVLITLLFCEWFRGEDCYNSLREGMPAEEADAIMERHGYKVIDGEVRHFAVTEVYSRNKLEPPIVLVFRDGVLKHKERDSGPEYLLQSLSDRLHGSAR
jgi:hypothetical protein